MKITATEEVGMRCMVQLALRPQTALSLGELATAEGLPEPFAAKVMTRLRRAGLVEAVRGRRGGYRLAKPPAAITVASVLRATGPQLFERSFCTRRHGRRGAACARIADCAVRPVWRHVNDLLDDFLSRTTLADLAAGEGAARDHLAAQWPAALPPRGAAPVAAV